MNSVLALQLLIELTAQAQKLSLLLQKATQENRDVNRDELESFRKEDDNARRRLQDAIDAGIAAQNRPFGNNDAFAQPPLNQLVVNPATGETGLQNQVDHPDVVDAEHGIKSADKEQIKSSLKK
jgi:hypothetical protein